MAPPFDVDRWRAEFPALAARPGERAVAYLDGPAGSQVPQTVIDAVGRYLGECNANTGGAFETSRRSDALIDAARRAAADLVGCSDPREIIFGPNMTTLTLGLSRALARTWEAGDEVVVTRLDHDANVTPWVLAARDAGAVVRHVELHRDDCTLDLEHLAARLGPRTRLVAVGCASNAVGTVNPVGRIAALAREAGALTFLDAVHHAPHLPIDVEAWGCDFLACSAYKFFGPHVGLLWGRRELLDSLPAYRLRPAPEAAPGRWETGTQNHEGLAGALAAIDYLARIGRAQEPAAAERRAALLAGFRAVGGHERRLGERLLDALESLPGVRVFGITDRRRMAERVPTVAFTHARRSPREVAEHLAGRGLQVWDGNFYALPLTEALGLEPQGLVRVGLLHYNTEAEVERLREALAVIG